MKKTTVIVLVMLAVLWAGSLVARPLRDSIIVAKKDTFTVPIAYRLSFDDPYQVPRKLVLDTINTHFYRYLPTSQPAPLTGNLGVVGQASYSLDYFANKPITSDVFLDPYSLWFFSSSNSCQYNTRRPFTRLNYASGANEESLFSAFHTQNVNKETNVGFDMRFLGALGDLSNQKSSGRQAKAFGSYFGSRYSCVAQFSYNRLNTKENGGISDYTDIASGQRLVNLYSASSSNKYTQVYLKQEVNLTGRYKAPDSIVLDLKEFPLSAGNELVFDNAKRTFTDNQVNTSLSFYNTTPVNPLITKDSALYRRLTNMFFVKITGNRKKGPALMVGYGLEAENCLFADYASYNDQAFVNNTFVHTKAWVKNTTTWGARAHARYYLSGRKANNYELSSTVYKNVRFMQRTMNVYANVLSNLATPSYFMNIYSSNFYSWNTTLAKQLTNTGNLGISSLSNEFDARISARVVRKHTYFDKESKPAQLSSASVVYAASVSKITRLSILSLETTLLWQRASTPEISIPELVTYNTLAATFTTFKKKLRLQSGVDVYYWSRFHAPAYSPELGVFYNQNDNMYGDYPVVDIFTQFNFKRLQLFLKYSHASFLFTRENRFFTVHRYPGPRSHFAYGISWYFYN